MTASAFGLLCALVVGVAMTLYLWGVRRRQLESSAGVDSLNAMHWREFAGLVLEMLYRRGYTAIEQHPLGSGDHSDILLRHGSGLCALSCKHGSAYRLGSQAVGEFADSIRMNDANGGIMVTPGSFAAEAYERASSLQVELIDGKTLWPEIAPLLPEALRARLQADAVASARRSIGFSWLLAVAVGVMAGLLWPGNSVEPATAASVAATSTAAVAKTATSTTMARPVGALSPEEIAKRRADVARAIAALPGIEQAHWSTQSTLSLFVSDDRNVWAGICGIISRYDELRATRVQLNPPAGSTTPVRFKQCHSY
ncbi:restriction endonuclease [Luteimonas cucumeris]|uniref:Restriction endonuclease n=1 Tax=Luteimonas cucumeris TaxID=985012 RepID=A0A562L8B8_9GAMM|nr:restriction endonuclease [Luteimonas cucumeris]TWI03927.1 restriction endonuclease [Luteimonas cucumeris]